MWKPWDLIDTTFFHTLITLALFAFLIFLCLKAAKCFMGEEGVSVQNAVTVSRQVLRIAMNAEMILIQIIRTGG